MNIKKIVTVCLLFVISITMCKSALSQIDAAGDFLSVPYFSEQKVRFYRTSNETLFTTFDIAAEFVNFPAITFGGPNAGPNATIIYDSKIFISFDNDPVGGVLIYNHNDLFPTRNSNPPVIISTAPVAGITIHPTTGDLYVAKFNASGVSGKITRYSKLQNYASSSAFDLPIPNTWVNYFTGIAFDAAGNLWTGDLWDHRIICFTASSGYDNFYVIGNGITLTYTAEVLTGGTATVRLLSSPEGFAFDNGGNLWFSNNNDWHITNNPGEGTFGTINGAYLGTILAQAPSGTRVDPNVTIIRTISAGSVAVFYVQDAKFGGMTFKGSTLYMSDQGNNKVWKWTLPNTFNTTNFVQAGTITAAYPGFGGLSVNDNTFPIGIKTISNNIPDKFKLSQNYPNPFNPSTNIRYQIPNNSFVTLKVYDILGKEVATLVNEKLQAGTYETQFSINSITNNQISSGVYFYRLTTDGFTDTKSMFLIK